jgi:hypothetical protein
VFKEKNAILKKVYFAAVDFELRKTPEITTNLFIFYFSTKIYDI